MRVLSVICIRRQAIAQSYAQLSRLYDIETGLWKASTVSLSRLIPITLPRESQDGSEDGCRMAGEREQETKLKMSIFGSVYSGKLNDSGILLFKCSSGRSPEISIKMQMSLLEGQRVFQTSIILWIMWTILCKEMTVFQESLCDQTCQCCFVSWKNCVRVAGYDPASRKFRGGWQVFCCHHGFTITKCIFYGFIFLS